MPRQKLVVHARLVIKAVEKSGGDELNEIAVALVVLAKQHQMVRALGLRAAIFVIVRRHIHFAADDRLHSVRGGLVIEIRGREKVPMIGHGDRGHPAAGRFLGEFPDFAGPVQQGVIGVQMQMYEVRYRHKTLFYHFAKRVCGKALRAPQVFKSISTMPRNRRPDEGRRPESSNASEGPLFGGSKRLRAVHTEQFRAAPFTSRRYLRLAFFPGCALDLAGAVFF